MEGLGEEALNFSGSCHNGPVLRIQLIKAQDCNNILKIPIALQDLLHSPGHAVVTAPHGLR